MIKMKNDYIDIKNTKWWIKFLLLFKKKYVHYARHGGLLYFITYKKLFGKIYLISDRLIGIDLH